LNFRRNACHAFAKSEQSKDPAAVELASSHLSIVEVMPGGAGRRRG